MLEGGGKIVAFVGIVAQPVQQLRESPLRGIDSAAPLNGFEFLPVSGLCDFFGFVDDLYSLNGW